MEYELPCEGKLLHDLDALFADDLDALFAETTAFDPVTFLEDMGIDVHAMATMEKKKPVNPPLPKRCFGNGKELKTLLRVLDDLRALFTDGLDALFAETTAFDPVTFLEDVGIDVHTLTTMEKKPVNLPLLKRCFGNGKELKTLHRVLSPPSCYLENLKTKDDSERDHRQDWNDEERMARSKRKLHQGYQDYQNQRRKIQVLDIKDLPKPAKPQRGNVFKNKQLKSRKCLAF
ncbi:unnamed protein product [Malus baccata var. baccata]